MNAKPTGVMAAWLVAAIAGIFFYVLTNIVGEIIAPLKSAMQIHNGVGPYSGKTLFGSLTTLLVGGVLHHLWRDRQFDLRIWTGAFAVLVLLAVVLVFPPVYEEIIHIFKR